MMEIEIDYNYSGIERVVRTPSVGQLIVFQKQLAKIQTSYKCNIVEAGDHGWSWIMCSDDQWKLKKMSHKRSQHRPVQVFTRVTPTHTNPDTNRSSNSTINMRKSSATQLRESKHTFMKIY